MKAMILQKQKQPLILQDVPKPTPQEDELLIKVNTCGVCRTDLHIQDGDLISPKLPLILGHEIVGTVVQVGKNVSGFRLNDRVGVPWMASTCGKCTFCKEGRENLCERPQFTGYSCNGGFAEYVVCKTNFIVALPPHISDEHAAPLMCAGLIGYRAYRMAHPKKTLGLYGFGAAAHILTQIAAFEGKEVYAFTRDGDHKKQAFAKKLGAVWAGDSQTPPPTPLDAAIIFAPAGHLVPQALKQLKKGGRCICGGIHMSDIPTFPYSDLWGEKSIQSVTNLTRKDAQDFFATIKQFPIQTEVTTYPLEQADVAINAVREGKLEGAAVLRITPT